MTTASETAIEKEIREKGLTAPRLTPELIDATIVATAFHVFDGTMMTVCALTLVNGFVVIGESACASPANFDAAIGRRIAQANARNKIWQLEGYLLRSVLSGHLTSVERIAQACHEVNRAYCVSIGDASQPAWIDAPQWQKDSAIAGVKFTIANPDATPAGSHESWLAEKRRDGWIYGPVKDAMNKTHPCFVPYDDLPAEQQTKDHLFQATVRSLI